MPTVNKVFVSPIIQIAGVIIIIAGLMSAQSIILPIIMALFVSIICMQPILWLTKKRVPYVLSILIVLICISVLFLSLGGLIGNSLANFSENAPQYESNLKEIATTFISHLNERGTHINSQQLIKMIDPGKIFNFTTGVVSGIGGVMSDSFIIMLITIFMLLEGKSLVTKAHLIEKEHGNSLEYLNEIGLSIRNYLSIKTAVSLATGLFIWIWLLIIGVDYAILWGLIAFLLNYIPNIGSIIAAVPTMLLALVQLGSGGMFWTAIGYLAVNIVMGSIIEPKVMGRGLGLSTLVVFLSLIIWGFIFGAVGMFLSVPLTMTIKIILKHYEKTRWIAVLLGSDAETSKMLKKS